MKKYGLKETSVSQKQEPLHVGMQGGVLKNKAFGFTAAINPKWILPYQTAGARKMSYELSVTKDYQDDFLVHRSVHESPGEAVRYLAEHFCGRWENAGLIGPSAQVNNRLERKLAEYDDEFGNHAVISRRRLYPGRNSRRKQEYYILSLRASYNNNYLYYRDVYDSMEDAVSAMRELSCDTWKEKVTCTAIRAV